ncbi:MAG: glycerophosphoryl diester phosphodiesterase membrane domain-containing protein [Candidatus Dependentiae bacterium]|nr:glycerophosphoryl diester phosphodiesterase membrane domain-containing protein [Candidatus Dependentiae bacterium]
MERTRKIPFFNPYEPLKFALRALVSQWHIALGFILFSVLFTLVLGKTTAIDLAQNNLDVATNNSFLFLFFRIVFSTFSSIFLIASALSLYKTGKIYLRNFFSAPLSAWMALFLVGSLELILVQLFNASYAVSLMVLLPTAVLFIYLAFKTMFVVPYLIDKKSSLIESIKKSFELTYRYKWRFIESLFLYTAFFGAIILVGIPVGIFALVALFFSIPFEQVEQWMAILAIVNSPIAVWIRCFAMTYVYCKIMADYENNEQERIGDSVDQKSVNE